MIREYLFGVKIVRMLSEESVMIMNAINKMISRYGYRFLPTFEQKPIITPAMNEQSKTVS